MKRTLGRYLGNWYGVFQLENRGVCVFEMTTFAARIGKANANTQ